MCANKTGKNFNLGKSGSGGSRFYYRHNKSEQYFGQYVSPISFSSNLVSLGFILCISYDDKLFILMLIMNIYLFFLVIGSSKATPSFGAYVDQLQSK